MNRPLRLVLRTGLRYALRNVFAGSGPRSGADLRRGSRPLPADALDGTRPPAPHELLGHTSTAVGRFADVDPLVAPGWQRRRGRLVVLGALGGLAWRRGRRELAADPRPDRAP